MAEETSGERRKERRRRRGAAGESAAPPAAPPSPLACAPPPAVPSQLETIRKRQARLLLQKLDQQRPLTPGEMAIVEKFFGAASPASAEASARQGGTDPKQPTSYASMGQAAAALKLPLEVLKLAKRQGCPAFRANRVYRVELIDWLAVHLHSGDGSVPGAPRGSLEQKRIEEAEERIRKLKLKNDHDAGLLLKRAWIVERMARARGEIEAFRARSESEHPVSFAAAGGDVVKCRTVVREIWDFIAQALASLHRHFEEGNDRKSA